MDSRDSTSSSSINVAREGSDDDGVLSATALLAKEAFALFQSDKFSECVDVLNQLLQKKEGDPKILHNIAVAKFLRDGCSDPKKLVEVLVNVKRKSEDLARASREQTDAASQAANKAISGAKGTNNLANSPSTVFTDEFDSSVAALNIATVLFHLHEYSKALSVLEPLFQNIEPIDETTALHVCLLLLDVAFVTQEASKFADVISYLEKAFGVSYMLNQADGGSTGQQPASNIVVKSSSIPNNSSASDDFNPEGTAAGNTSEGSLSRTLSDETIEYETLLSTLDISGQNISRASHLSTSNDLLRTPADRSTPTINLRLQLPLYKIQLLLLTRNLKAAKREVKLAMNIARDIDSSRALLLKSQLEYARGNNPKAFKLLRASNSQSDVGSSIIINNNIGCIYYQQGNQHTSSIFFHKALSNCSSLWKEKPRKLATFSQDKSFLIAYNCGVQYLSCGKPVLAARFFLKACLVFYNRPLLWLRLAECCLMALDKGLLKRTETPRHESQVKVQVIGQGKWRHLAFENGSLRSGFTNPDDREDLSLEKNSKPTLSLSFARQCLLNSLHLLGNSELKHIKSGSLTKSSAEESESTDVVTAKNLAHKNLGSNDTKSKDTAGSGQMSTNGDAKEQRGGAHSNTAAANTLSEYEEICKRENHKLKQAILIDLAFVELELGNPLNALSTALTLLNIPECSRMNAFLGHVYAAEALCLLNRPKEAAEHLSTYLASGNVELPYSEDDCRQWQAKKTLDAEDSNTGQTAARGSVYEEQQDNVFLSPEEARGALYVNLASMHVLQGELEQASRYAAQALATLPASQEAALMAVYLDLKLAKSREALIKLKRCCWVQFLPFSSRSKAAS
ncbi:CCR4-NOT transcription complex subunit 10-like [Chenopodium quinoa]|uniref:CCR4-NOT transcription complex subunit 10 n=1 Tax=Chenopodium quinoa TaxID=63459 RepID=A0A803LH60_CHEQI|nr:CCR4-NOT transcription complex subunit 10-like [Chenopodium quinoa]